MGRYYRPIRIEDDETGARRALIDGSEEDLVRGSCHAC